MNQKKYIKNITIEYYNTCSLIKLEEKINAYTRGKIDISELLENLHNRNVKDRIINYNGENIILSSIEYNNQTNLWELIFFKSRSATTPFIVDSNGISRKIILKDDEMISEVLCAEYNSETKILAIQRNVYAFGTKGLEEFFSKFLQKPLYLESIQKLNKEKKSLLKKSKIKKFKLHIKNIKDDKNPSKGITQYNKDTSICKAIDSALQVNSAIINIEFSMGNSSQTITLENDDFEVFQDLMNNNNVKCLELGLVPDEHSTMQVTDFMDFRIYDIISIPFEKGNSIDFTEIIKRMAEKFQNNLYLK